MSSVDRKSKGALKQLLIWGGLAAVAGFGAYHVFWKDANVNSGDQDEPEELIKPNSTESDSKKKAFRTIVSEDIKEESLIADTKPSVHFDDHSSDNGLRSRIMAHRGFHHRGAGNNERPLENTMAAYVKAAENGYVLGECDVTISTDGIVFLIHNNTLKSLAADATSSLAQRKVSELTWEEISSIPLNDGGDNSTRCVTLEDVLGFCAGTKLRIMVELKRSAGLPLVDRLVEFFTDNMILLQYVFCFASFDPSLIAALKQKMKPMGVKLPLFLGLYFNKRIKYFEEESYFDIAEDDWMQKLVERKEKYDFDGFYLEYQPSWSEHAERMRKLTSTFFVATWVRGNTPLEKDTQAFVDHCLSLGVRIVNSDLPDTFWDTKSSKANVSVLDEQNELAECNMMLKQEINAMNANTDKDTSVPEDLHVQSQLFKDETSAANVDSKEINANILQLRPTAAFNTGVFGSLLAESLYGRQRPLAAYNSGVFGSISMKSLQNSIKDGMQPSAKMDVPATANPILEDAPVDVLVGNVTQEPERLTQVEALSEEPVSTEVEEIVAKESPKEGVDSEDTTEHMAELSNKVIVQDSSIVRDPASIEEEVEAKDMVDLSETIEEPAKEAQTKTPATEENTPTAGKPTKKGKKKKKKGRGGKDGGKKKKKKKKASSTA